MSSHHESSPHVFDLLGIGWLRTNAEGIPLDANDQCAGLFDAPDSAALIERMRAGAVVLPDELMMHLRSARNVQPGELVASRIACMLRPDAARVYVSVIARDDAFDVLLLPGSMTPPSRSDFALRDYARRLRLLTQQIIDVQENERRNLARELHDEIGQQLTIVRLSLEAVRESIADNGPLEDALSSVADLTRQVRELSLDLRPSMLDDLGLPAALRWYATRAARLAGFDVILDIEPEFPRLLTSVETLYFRVAQEAITNILRHAAARTLTVSLRREAEDVRLTVTDDGSGFDFPAACEAALRGQSGGLLGMQERAALCGAELHVESASGSGTRLSLKIPFSCAGIPAFCA